MAPLHLTALSIQDFIEHLGTDERETATSALLVIGQAAIEPLCTALTNPSWRIAASAACVLGKIGSSTAVEPLIQAVKYLVIKQDYFFVIDSEEYEQECFYTVDAAIWALGQIGDVKGIAPIINLMSYKQYRFRAGRINNDSGRAQSFRDRCN